jgi:hypothetical protein
MSYATMDHAGWVETNGACAKRNGGRPRRDREGRLMGWLAMPEKLSPFQARVMDILGLSLGGIYNAPIAWDAVRWGHAAGRWAQMAVPLGSRGGMATHDANPLTLLVLACHQARIRLSIAPNGPSGLMLHFSQRDGSGTFADGHPNIDEAVKAFRKYVPEDHRITYRAAAEVPA